MAESPAGPYGNQSRGWLPISTAAKGSLVTGWPFKNIASNHLAIIRKLSFTVVDSTPFSAAGWYQTWSLGTPGSHQTGTGLPHFFITSEFHAHVIRKLMHHGKCNKKLAVCQIMQEMILPRRDHRRGLLVCQPVMQDPIVFSSISLSQTAVGD
jgi:hypothetical protein